MKREMEFLGLVVGKSGLKVDTRKIQVIKDWETPKSVTEIRSFLGLAQFFTRFIKDFSKISAPLTKLTKKNQSILNWDESCDEAFSRLKDTLVNAPVLNTPDWKKPFRGHIDASSATVGGTLTQFGDDDMEHPVVYYSKKLSPAEMNYSANDRELLGLISFLQRFRCYLEGQTFEIFADNQVLKYFFTKSSLSRREARWLETLGNFGIFPINLKAGKIHVLGGALSRIPNVMNSKDETSAVVNAVEIFEVDKKEIISGYEDDQFFRKFHKAFQGTFFQNER